MNLLGKNTSGYTLIELLVSVSIFAILVSSITEIFISSLRAQRRVLAYGEIVDSSSYALEYMGRFLRMAEKDDLEGFNCLIGNKVNYEITSNPIGIKFKNYHGQCEEFYLKDGQIRESRNSSNPSESLDLPLTPSDLEVSDLRFEIYGESQNDTIQPRVTISFNIHKKGEHKTMTKFQTTISQRNLDTKY